MKKSWTTYERFDNCIVLNSNPKHPDVGPFITGAHFTKDESLIFWHPIYLKNIMKPKEIKALAKTQKLLENAVKRGVWKKFKARFSKKTGYQEKKIA